MHILIPLDGSAFAESAIEPAAALLRRSADPASLTFLRIVGYSAVHYDLTGFAPVINESAYQAALEGGQDYLAHVATRRPLHGIRVATSTQMGSAIAADICQAARDLGADLIMLASHTRTGVAHFVLGSVAEAVLRDAPVPTLILHRDGAAFPALDRDEPLTILVLLDGTPMAEAALAPAVRLAAQMRGAIRVLRVLPAHADTATDQRLVAEARADFARVRAVVAAQGVPMQESLAWGEVEAHIIGSTQEHQTDLIAIATHGRTGLDQWREGSITLALLHHLPLPLLVVHPLSAVNLDPAPLDTVLEQPA